MSRNIFIPRPEARLVPRHPAPLTIETFLWVAPLGLRSGSISIGIIILSSDDAERFLKLTSEVVVRGQPWFYLRLVA
jgi:hypothetical protein